MPGIDIDPKLTAILQALRERERILQKPAPDTSPADLEALFGPDFWETGASGRHYSRQDALRELARRQRPSRPAAIAAGEMSELRCQKLAENVYLLTYALRQAERITRRASIWRRTETDWQILYHQGTVVSASPAGT